MIEELDKIDAINIKNMMCRYIQHIRNEIDYSMNDKEYRELLINTKVKGDLIEKYYKNLRNKKGDSYV